MTTTTAQRFTLDEDKAREWLARAIAQAEREQANGRLADRDDSLPRITGEYRASSGQWSHRTAELVAFAIADGIITDAEPSDLGTLTWEYVSHDANGGVNGYRWLLNIGPGTTDDPGELVTMAYPSPEDMWGFGLNDQNREIAGAEAALSVLRQAVSAGNDLAERFTAYVSALPLAVRAPEVAGLVAQLPEADQWGSDELGKLSNWLVSIGAMHLHPYDSGTACSCPTPQRDAPPEYLCDKCWEEATGLLAVCQDGCSQPLDHDGLCAGRVDVQDCWRCGKSGRLTELEV